MRRAESVEVESFTNGVTGEVGISVEFTLRGEPHEILFLILDLDAASSLGETILTECEDARETRRNLANP